MFIVHGQIEQPHSGRSAMSMDHKPLEFSHASAMLLLGKNVWFTDAPKHRTPGGVRDRLLGHAL
jgi:hypothetical protein